MSKQERIASIVSEIDAEIKRAAQLQKEGWIEKAKDIYVAQADVVMSLIKETTDDPNFQQSLKTQCRAMINKVSPSYALTSFHRQRHCLSNFQVRI